MYTFKFFPQAFPIVNIDITTDRDQAVDIAKAVIEKHRFGPQDASVAVTFNSNSQVQTFVELAGGGQVAFRIMLKENYYMPYTWHIRQFKEFEKNESHVYITPQGTLYGFKEKISDDEIRPTLTGEEALKLILETLQQDLSIDTSVYALVEEAKNIQLNGRVDRTFVFERTDISLNEGRYRIKAKILGNTLSEIKQFVKIPQSFTLAYNEMRAANTSISSAASMFAFIFYLIIGCLFAIFILLRQNWIIWTTPTKWALLIAFLQFLNALNSLPLMWMHYQTETGKLSFFLHILINAFSSFVMTFITTSLIFIAAESLTRKAFGKHIRLWDSWNPHIANSYTMLGQTIGGYIMIGIDLAFLVTFYYLSTTYLHWWTPLTQLINPNILATYLPWLSSIAKSLQAGFVEEAQFRAIPLASAALLGERFGNRNRWIFVAFIIQAIVFGAAHADYAAQPAYARLLELILPSCIFAGLYLRFGLLISVIMHYAYDVFWFALPIFLSQAPGIRIHQAAVLFFTFLPLLIVFYQRFKIGIWERLHTTAFNATWHPTAKPLFEQIITAKTIFKKLSQKQNTALATIGILCCIILLFTARFRSDTPPLKISREEAIAIAQKALIKDGHQLDGFQAYAKIKPALENFNEKDSTHRYVWQTYKKSAYDKLLGSYVYPAHFVVRFLKFSGSLQDRAESYELIVGPKNNSLDPTYEVLSSQHKIAESAAGAQLEKKEARRLAEKTLIINGINPSDVYEVSAIPKQLPQRIDWTFTFAHTQINPVKEGEARIVVTLAGDQPSHYYQKIHLPETWKRHDQKEQAEANALQMLCNLLIRIICLLSMCIALLFLAYKKISGRILITAALLFVSIFTIRFLNNWPQFIAQFNTSASFFSQVFQVYGKLILHLLIHTIIFASMFSLILQTKQRYAYADKKTSFMIGIITGIFVATMLSVISFFTPSHAPVWGYYNTLGLSFPFFGFINTFVVKYLQYTALWTFFVLVLNFITDSGKRYITAAILLCVVSGIVFTGFEATDLLAFKLIAGCMFGIGVFLLWYYLLRFSSDSIPITLATVFSLELIQQMIFNVLPHIFILGILCIACIIACAGYLSNHMRRLHA
jgi:uncharacterized protein YpmB